MSTYTRPTLDHKTQEAIIVQASKVKGLFAKWKLMPMIMEFRRLIIRANGLRDLRHLDRLGTDEEFNQARQNISAALNVSQDSVRAARLLLTESASLVLEIEEHQRALVAEAAGMK